jgi:hypothetical protein
MSAREFVMVCVESSYGTTKTTPVLGTDRFYARLDRANAFTMEAMEDHIPIGFGGGYAVEADTAGGVVKCGGRFAFTLYPGIYSTILLNWAINRINSGRTTPWTTTDASGVMPVGDLASLSFYHAMLKEDGTTYLRTRYSGVKCEDWELAAQETGEGRVWTLSGSCTGIKPVGNAWDSSTDPDATEFPVPAATDYPTGPYTFGHLATGTGVLTIATSRAAECKSVRIRGQNRLTPNYYTGRFLRTHRWVGRAVTADVELRYRASPDDRAAYRARTAQSTTIKLDNGTTSIQLAMPNCLIRPWGRDTPNDQEYGQKLTLAARYDTSSTTDLTLTLA